MRRAGLIGATSLLAAAVWFGARDFGVAPVGPTTLPERASMRVTPEPELAGQGPAWADAQPVDSAMSLARKFGVLRVELAYSPPVPAPPIARVEFVPEPPQSDLATLSFDQAASDATYELPHGICTMRASAPGYASVHRKVHLCADAGHARLSLLAVADVMLVLHGTLALEEQQALGLGLESLGPDGERGSARLVRPIHGTGRMVDVPVGSAARAFLWFDEPMDRRFVVEPAMVSLPASREEQIVLEYAVHRIPGEGRAFDSATGAAIPWSVVEHVGGGKFEVRAELYSGRLLENFIAKPQLEPMVGVQSARFKLDVEEGLDEAKRVQFQAAGAWLPCIKLDEARPVWLALCVGATCSIRIWGAGIVPLNWTGAIAVLRDAAVRVRRGHSATLLVPDSTPFSVVRCILNESDPVPCILNGALHWPGEESGDSLRAAPQDGRLTIDGLEAGRYRVTLVGIDTFTASFEAGPGLAAEVHMSEANPR